MPLNEQALQEAQAALRITDVFFRDERVAVDPEVTPPFWPEAARTQFKMVTRILHDFEVADDDASDRRRFLELEFAGSVRCLAGPESENEGDQRELLSSDVSVGLLYEVTAACSDEGIEEFVRANAPYHAIPYWREHVHALCAKRRFPPITVPMYRRPLRLQDSAAPAPADAASGASG